MKILLYLLLGIFFSSFYYLLLMGYELQRVAWATEVLVLCIASFLLLCIVGLVYTLQKVR